MTIRPKPRAKYTPHLGTWAAWIRADDFLRRLVGYGYTLSEALEDMRNKREAK